MTEIGTSRFFRSWISLCIALCLLLAGVVSAQNGLEPPKNSYVALRVLPTDYYGDTLDRRELKSHPLFRLIGVAGQKYLGIEPLEFLDETFEGTIVAALLDVEGSGGSTLKKFFEDREGRDAWKRLTSELESLDADLKVYFEEHESYPEDLDVYLEEVRFFQVSLPGNASYKYERFNDGKDFRLSADLSESPTMAKLGKAPVFSSQGEAKNCLLYTSDAADE